MMPCRYVRAASGVSISYVVLAFGDPRYRTVYDVFGFALLGALLADRFCPDRPEKSTEPATLEHEQTTTG
jgi:hypothetical protein